jgi:hypothetical protein
LAPVVEFLSAAASFELRITEIGPAVLELFDSTFTLEISVPGLKIEAFWGIALPLRKPLCLSHRASESVIPPGLWDLSRKARLSKIE